MNYKAKLGVASVLFLGVSAAIGPLQHLSGIKEVAYLYGANYVCFLIYVIHIVVQKNKGTIISIFLCTLFAVVYALSIILVGFTIAMNTSNIH